MYAGSQEEPMQPYDPVVEAAMKNLYTSLSKLPRRKRRGF
jgi:hypothetical protein